LGSSYRKKTNGKTEKNQTENNQKRKNPKNEIPGKKKRTIPSSPGAILNSWGPHVKTKYRVKKQKEDNPKLSSAISQTCFVSLFV
jgi:hypothetical protein